jgi:endo-1,3-1,4-beta-glycanase ExoK
MCIYCSTNVFSKNYRGAEIYTKTAVKYGRFEMSMKAGVGSGLLSTFFLYKNGSEQSGAFWEEIDIEIFGKNSAKSFQTNIITDGVTGNNKMSEKLHSYAFSLADTFHTYRLEWTPTYVAFFFDNKEIRRDTKTTQVNSLVSAESIRFNAWISGSASWAGSFNPSVLPQNQYVDWFKYSSYDASAEGSFKLEWVDDFSTFNTQRWGKANWTFDSNLVDFSPDNAYIENGVLVLALTDSNGPTGLDALGKSADPSIYPNPATSEINLNSQLVGQYDCFTIYNLMGSVVAQGKLAQGMQTINIEVLKSGLYLIKLSSKTRNVSYRFFKQD